MTCTRYDDVEVLVAEAVAQFSADPRITVLTDLLEGRHLRLRNLQQALANLDPDSDEAIELNEQAILADQAEKAALYCGLGKLDRAALCLSGGGIRSASFALGILQSLAGHPRGAANRPSPADQSLLGQMHFLSTVSGGGYIGSWLSAWIHRAGFASAQAGLVGRVTPDIEPEPIAHLRRYSNYLTPKLGLLSADSWTAIALYFRNLFLNWLILIPAICLPLILMKLFAALAAFFARVPDEPGTALILHVLSYMALIGGAVCMVFSLVIVTRNRPIYAEDSVGQTGFLGWALLPLILASIGWCGFILSPALTDILHLTGLSPTWIGTPGADTTWAKVIIISVAAVIGALKYGLGWLFAAPWKHLRGEMRRPMHALRNPARGPAAASVAGSAAAPAAPPAAIVAPAIRHGIDPVHLPPRPEMSRSKQLVADLVQSMIGGLVYGALLGVGIYLLLLLPRLTSAPVIDCGDQIPLAKTVTLQIQSNAMCVQQAGLLITPDHAHTLQLFAVVTLGLPWLMFAQLTGEAVFTGLSSFARFSDSDREWLGRAAGWYLLTAIGWIAVVLLVYGGSVLLLPADQRPYDAQGWIGYLTSLVQSFGHYLAPIGGISGIATALLGSSSLTGGRDKARADQSPILRAIASNALNLAALIFLIALVVFLSVGLDFALLSQSIFGSQLLALKVIDTAALWRDLRWLAIGFVLAMAITVIASHYININRFSLHALYRNRLIREFLGASRRKRRPNAFTGFSTKDNLAIHKLRHSAAAPAVSQRPMQIVNMTLNLVATENLAWQERKGESFTMSALHSGSAGLGYCDSATYGAGESDGISLGTAMAISGAAVSPNMGYHSSPLIAFLLSLLNVRLGWWLGNPKRDHAEEDGPSVAIKWYFYEAFGLTKADKDFLYLSDGGHFENLGLYEMVRRRCRYVIVSDAGCDPTCALEDLGNAVRKIEIDLGVRVSFTDLDELRPRLSVEDAQGGKSQSQDSWAVGTIHYSELDDGAADGSIIYIKPSFRGSESAGIRAYALAHEDFPHESTSDQWFGESQFESYRKLGFEIAEEILRDRVAPSILAGTTPTIGAFFAAL